MDTVTVKMPRELIERARLEARERGMSVSEYVRFALRALEKKQGRRKTTVGELASKLFGALDSGVSDLGSNKTRLRGFGQK
jgi:Arc/MetJ-type ribon-helix-helix transcriptional regulator